MGESEFSPAATVTFVIGLLIVAAIVVSLYRRRRK
ncbi:LPXTG cell wall anchor domain-containing protein [Cohnella sp. REN36]|nr:LPXTG cell wall anchor domain-containing protein [Cohnella sp. REN36]MCC3371678.1 LPXTG cell wall anchor domain-containing protein [Cohnella sp. REN36]